MYGGRRKERQADRQGNKETETDKERDKQTDIGEREKECALQCDNTKKVIRTKIHLTLASH